MQEEEEDEKDEEEEGGGATKKSRGAHHHSAQPSHYAIDRITISKGTPAQQFNTTDS